VTFVGERPYSVLTWLRSLAARATFLGKNMNILKNKHLLAASLVAPLLALMSYFAIDYFVGESPHAAEAGQSYQLVEKSNCRYDSGACDLQNGEFRLSLSPEWGGEGQLLLTLRSEFPLEGVVISLVASEVDDNPPVNMQAISDDGLAWSVNLDNPVPGKDRLRLVASANQSLWFGDVALKFALPDAGQ
jgi:hypothetical protein